MTILDLMRDPGTKAHSALRLVGALRLLSGVVFVIRPTSIAPVWVGRADRQTTTLTRAVGARDAIIGAGLAANGTPAWLAASIAADTADGLDALLGDVPDERRSRVAGWAFGFAVLGIAAECLRRRD